jgi:hypothetical protein
MTERGAVHERLSQLMEMEEDMILAGFHRKYKKQETNPDMTNILKRRVLRRETYFFSMTVKFFNILVILGCIG